MGRRARSQQGFHQVFLSVGVAEQLATMKGRYLTLEWYPFYQVHVHESEMAALVLLLSTVSGAPVATTEGAELLGITADKLVVACRPGNLRRGRGARRTEIREVVATTHNLQQRGLAEAGDVRFAVEQRLDSAVMLVQEVRSWPGSQNVLLGSELFTDVGLDPAVAIPREFACDVREKVLNRFASCVSGYLSRFSRISNLLVESKKYTFVVLFGTVWGSVHLPCHGDVTQDDLLSMLKEMEDVVINLRRRHHTSRNCDWM